MAKVIDMQFMRYMNLFEKISRVSTTDCFLYNNAIVFAVPKSKVSQAIGPGAANIKKMSDTLRKKIKVVALPKDKTDLKGFISEIVEPIEVNSVEVKEGVVLIASDRQGKAMMIGRNRVREQELIEILSKTFGLKIVKFV
jgi:NusA-like KH domain protein